MPNFYPWLRSGAKDLPDKRDFSAEHLFGMAPMAIPDSIDLTYDLAALDQQETNHCTAYSLTHIHEILNTMEHHQKMRFNPEEQWNNQLEYPGTATEAQGDYIQSALKSLRKYGLKNNNRTYNIQGYAKINTDSIKYWLAKKFPIFTGTEVTRTNYMKAEYEGIYGGRDGEIIGGHAVCIVGYKPGFFIVRTSWGADWGKFKNGNFLIREADISLIMTPYIIYDVKDAISSNQMIFKDVSVNSFAASEIKWCVEKGIFKGYGDENLPPQEKLFMPEKAISRAEMAIVLKRFFDLVK